MKVTQHKTGSMRPIEPFQTLEEEANYWDSHDATQEIDKNTVIGFHKANKTETLTVRFEEGDIQELRQKASRLGIGPTTLIRIWIMERLKGARG